MCIIIASAVRWYKRVLKLTSHRNSVTIALPAAPLLTGTAGHSWEGQGQKADDRTWCSRILLWAVDQLISWYSSSFIHVYPVVKPLYNCCPGGLGVRVYWPTYTFGVRTEWQPSPLLTRPAGTQSDVQAGDGLGEMWRCSHVELF